MSISKVLHALERHGLLLLHDKSLPSVSLIVAGEPIAGSWWAHPAGSAIFHASSALDDQADVLCTKLVAGKVTFVHQTLWPALLTMAESGEAWQTHGLDAATRRALERVRADGGIRGDSLGAGHSKLVTGLEARLLCFVRQIHSESGKHVRVLESWPHWRARVGFERHLDPVEARAALERAAKGLDKKGKRPRLPWDR